MGRTPVIHRFSISSRVHFEFEPCRVRMLFVIKNMPWASILLLPLWDLGFLASWRNFGRFTAAAAKADLGAKGFVRISSGTGRPLRPMNYVRTLARAVTLAVSMVAGYLLALPAVPKAVRARFRPTDHLTGADKATFRFEPGRTGESAAV